MAIPGAPEARTIARIDEGIEFAALVIWDVFRSMIRLGANLTCIAVKDNIEPGMTKLLSYFFGLVFAIFSSLIFYNIVTGILTSALKFFFYPIIIIALVGVFMGCTGHSFGCCLSMPTQQGLQGMFNVGTRTGPGGDLGGVGSRTQQVPRAPSTGAGAGTGGTGEAISSNAFWSSAEILPGNNGHGLVRPRPPNQTQSEEDFTIMSMTDAPILQPPVSGDPFRSESGPGSQTEIRTGSQPANVESQFGVEGGDSSQARTSESGTVLD